MGLGSYGLTGTAPGLAPPVERQVFSTSAPPQEEPLPAVQP